MLKKTEANVYLSLSLNSLPIFKEVFRKSGVAVSLKHVSLLLVNIYVFKLVTLEKV